MSRLSDIQQKRMDYFLCYLRKRFGKGGLRILDIGCQTGELCSFLKQEGYEPLGIEVQTELIEHCRREFPGISFATADSENRLPFEDHSFDIVFSGDVIEHVRFTDVFVNEINTIPGFTTISMYSKMWAATGIEYPVLLDRLIALALERHAEKQQLRTSLT